MRQEYMIAFGLKEKEFNDLLICGWRKFGVYFFKPNCQSCFECTPIRVKVNQFIPSKNQKRIILKNRDTKVVFNKLNFSNEIFEIYSDHSLNRFKQKSNIEDFKSTFYLESVPSCQSEYYINNKLVAIGFIDISDEALSSVYFIYRTEYNFLNMGTFGAIKEIEYAKILKLKYYYLGYYIKENHSMSYKNKFKPYQLFDWKKQMWND